MTDLTAATAALVTATGELVGTKAEFLDWSTGTVTGGPHADGSYPFTAADGTIILVPCPAKIAAMNGDPTAAAATLQTLVDAARTAKTGAETAAGQAGGNAQAATDAVAQAKQAALDAAGAASTQVGALSTPNGATIVDDSNVKGGYRSVADLASRDAIPANRRRSGMRVKVLGDDGQGQRGTTFELQRDLDLERARSGRRAGPGLLHSWLHDHADCCHD